jgi:Fe-S cluster assembly ATP-binding protein
MLKIDKLNVSVDDKKILNGLSLVIKPGEVHAVMGPNGSGKSTLAYTLAGHPKYKVESGKIYIDKNEIQDMSPDERANLGLFLAMQYPVSVPGLTTLSFLWQIYKNRNKTKTSVVDFKNWLQKQSEMLNFNPELLKRSLNDGFSGGEKKKLEILQMIVSSPKYIILDEIDSGLDVDALKKIAQTVAKIAKEMNIGVLLITHYSRILEYVKADWVHIMREGKMVESGGVDLVKKIEKEGYEVARI